MGERIPGLDSWGKGGTWREIDPRGRTEGMEFRFLMCKTLIHSRIISQEA